MSPQWTRRGIAELELGLGAAAAAPVSGVRLGVGQAGPVSIRMFRVGGTRIVTPARVSPSQLLVVRAVAGGVPVQVVTSRPQLWQPLLAGAAHCRVLPDADGLQPTGGPGLIVDDRPARAGAPIEIRPWQCRIDVRTQWTVGELPGFARYDLALFGAVSPETTPAVARAFALPRDGADPLTRLDSASFAVVRRARFALLTLDPSSAEARLLDSARGLGSAAARPIGSGRG